MSTRADRFLEKHCPHSAHSDFPGNGKSCRLHIKGIVYPEKTIYKINECAGLCFTVPA